MHPDQETNNNFRSDVLTMMLSPVESIVIWGAKGHAKVLAEFLPQLGHPIIALFDNDSLAESPIPDVPLFYGRDGFVNWFAKQTRPSTIRGLVAIGGTGGAARMEIQQWMSEIGIAALPVAIHPTAFVATDVQLGTGTQVLALAAVCSGVRLGMACIINTHASVDHESLLGDGVHLAPGATLAGCVTVGDRTMIGVGAIVLPRICIGSDTVIGAGAVVTQDIPGGVVAYGNPARIIRDNHR